MMVMTIEAGPVFPRELFINVRYHVAVAAAAPGQSRLGCKVLFRRAVAYDAFNVHEAVFAHHPGLVLRNMTFRTLLAVGFHVLLCCGKQEGGEDEYKQQNQDPFHNASSIGLNKDRVKGQGSREKPASEFERFSSP
jgi:hypothetical protein